MATDYLTAKLCKAIKSFVTAPAPLTTFTGKTEACMEGLAEDKKTAGKAVDRGETKDEEEGRDRNKKQENKNRNNVEHTFDKTEESMLLRKFTQNWEETFYKEDMERLKEEDIKHDIKLKAVEENHSVNQPKVYSFKSRKYINAKSN